MVLKHVSVDCSPHLPSRRNAGIAFASFALEQQGTCISVQKTELAVGVRWASILLGHCPILLPATGALLLVPASLVSLSVLAALHALPLTSPVALHA